ncbi:caspase Dronc [Drosophila nasuta]|uniref:caspase Dronc n=1 Tax=Drosophila nasuta TaxID=42062 RepID=UPI00295E2342|nr:caspase Dronc [Drosophila nasuta]
MAMEVEPERELGMQQKHRKHIESNIPQLINCTDYKALMNETVACGLLSLTMRDNIELLNGEAYNMSAVDLQHEQHRKYFEKITKRGPHAYEALKQVFKRLRLMDALRILESVDDSNGGDFISLSNNNQQRNSNLSQIVNNNNNADIVDNRLKPTDPSLILQPYTQPLPGQTRVVIKSDRIHTDKLPVYKMQSQHNRGVLLIVNIIDFLNVKRKRKGAEGDGTSLIHVFREFGFTVFNYDNLNQKEFFSTLQKLTESEYVQRTECFVLVLMTHGMRLNEKDRVEFKDGSICKVSKIIDHFQADKCPHLHDKPKVLIFPFCRGEQPDAGRHVQLMPQPQPQIDTDSISSTNINVPTLNNLLVAYASIPGYETHRDEETGSWYIQKLCDIFARNAHNTCLEDMLKLIQDTVGNMRTREGNLQTAQYENNGFSKKLYFNPGFYLGKNDTAN